MFWVQQLYNNYGHLKYFKSSPVPYYLLKSSRVPYILLKSLDKLLRKQKVDSHIYNIYVTVHNVNDGRVKFGNSSMCSCEKKAPTLLWKKWRVQAALVWFYYTRCTEGHGMGTRIFVRRFQRRIYTIRCMCFLLYKEHFVLAHSHLNFMIKLFVVPKIHSYYDIIFIIQI